MTTSGPINVQGGLGTAYEVLRRRFWLMLVIFLGIVSASILYVVRTTPEFAANSLLIVDDRRYDPSNALNMGYIPSLDNSSAEMQLEVLSKSPAIAQGVAAAVLELKVIPGTDERFSVLGDEEPSVGALASYLQQNVIKVDLSGINIIGVSARTSNAPESAFLANAFASEAVEHSTNMSRQRITSSREFLEKRVAEGRQNLASSEQDMQYYMNRERAVALDQEVAAAVSNLANVENSLAQARIDLETERASLRATEVELAKIKPMLSQRVASGVDREIQTSQERVAELEARLELFFQQYPALRNSPESDPRAAPLAAEISQLKVRISDLSDRYVQELLAAGGSDPTKPESGVAYAASLERQLVTGRITISGIESKIGQLERQGKTYDARLSTFPKQSVELAKLQRARESSEQLFSSLEENLHQVTMAEQSETGSLRILRSAGIPLRPDNPRPERIIPLAALLGLFLSAGLGLLATRMDHRLYTPADVEMQGFRLIGVIPEMKPIIKRLFNGSAFVENRGRKVMTTMIGLTAPLSAPAEAYRQLYSKLRSMRNAHGAHTIVVTSPEANVGKSTTALNLAIASAMAHRRTLIVDVDLRKPAIQRYLGVQQRLTLQDLFELPDGVDPTKLISERSATGFPNLHAITVRESVGNPLGHLISPRLQVLIEAFKKDFEVVIFDAPPLLLTSDATFLTSLCDVTVVVAGVGRTDEAALRQVHTQLQEADAQFTGVVLNRFDPSNRNFKTTYGYLSQNYGGYYGHAVERSGASTTAAR